MNNILQISVFEYRKIENLGDLEKRKNSINQYLTFKKIYCIIQISV